MFNEQTYEAIMNRALSRVPSNMDIRQGSIIWDALASACVELAQMYIELDNILNLTFAETSYDEWLDKRCREMGVHRRKPTNAIRLGVMAGSDNTLIDVPIGSRFSIETINYVVVERIELGNFKLQCEQLGLIGNQFFGRLIPVDNVRNLVRAELGEIIIPGENIESDESLFERYEERVNVEPYGGNIDDYTIKTRSIEGIGNCKVIPIWNGGGTVKVIIIDSLFNSPSNTLIDRVQETIDPVPFTQKGKGIAPIGHRVTVTSAEEVIIDIDVSVTLLNGTTIGQVQDEIKKSIDNYLLNQRKEWANQTNIVIRVAQLVSAFITIQGVEDIKSLSLNGQQGNVVLEESQIPIKGSVNIHE